jgi:DNA ligase D-like protein (predicted 3'-phosphoesterase)
MALEEYRKKRDFSRTPEPAGKAARPSAPERFFCVQKHLASHLHYDFRLEHNGVLLSWAVPKGPSLDPKTKRLAMQVEDHPLDYGDFEGVIPEGYGAGIVMLWDRGTWIPEVPDVDAALKKGDLKFTLSGYKLKGSWVLVRTGGRYPGARSGSDARSWLLIKHRDEWAGELDITAFAPRSVKSNGDFEDILAEKTPAIWRSNRPAKGGEAGAMLAQIIERAAKLKKTGDEEKPRKHEARKETRPHRPTQEKGPDERKPRKLKATKRSRPRRAASTSRRSTGTTQETRGKKALASRKGRT